MIFNTSPTLRPSSTHANTQAADISSAPSTCREVLPRGFKPGWSTEQRQQIFSLLCKGSERQQQQQEQPPPNSSGGANRTAAKEEETPPEEAVEGNVRDGNNGPPGGDGDNVSSGNEVPSTPPGFLSDADIATLGAASGGDVDPSMTAIFKVLFR